MKLAIMQPYFIPNMGYFSLIDASDQWIVFDTPQYIRHGWVNRNRILKPIKDEWQYISVPLEKHSRNATIKEVRIRQNGWQKKMMAQLDHYKKKARYFGDVTSILNDNLFKPSAFESLVDLNIGLLRDICLYCEVEFNAEIFSEMKLELGKVNAADEWALEISKSLGATTYLNPIGGMEFFDRSKYENAGIELYFLENDLQPYFQPNDNFIPGLSIIDALMFHSPSDVRQMIRNYKYK